MPHLAFSNVEVQGSELQVNFAPPGEYGETTSCALWPEMGAPGAQLRPTLTFSTATRVTFASSKLLSAG